MKRALLVIDMQNDYLWDERKKKFNYDTSLIVRNVNNTINKYKNECDVIYISHLIQNIITNRLLFGFSIEGTLGAELYDGLDVVSDFKFNKYFPDAYKMKEFKKFMEEKEYEEVILCGLDQCGCVYHTAMGALKVTKNVSIVTEATACRYSKEKYDKVRNKLELLGVKFI